MNSVLKYVLIFVMCFLIILSVIALIEIHILNSNIHNLSFSSKGVANYLNSYSEYKTLFIFTVTIITAYFGLERLNEATNANILKIKHDHFQEWKSSIEYRLIYADTNNHQIRKVFAHKRLRFFDDLYKIDFVVKDKNQLTQLFSHFKDIVPFIESQNDTYVKQGGIYQTDRYAYSYDAFRYLFLGCLHEPYIGIEEDLADLFLQELPKDRTINSQLYASAISRR
ncbi:hypothetical protein EZS27_024189 [termite gut metagenome]|uniref:Uncharacterized protein n=1 Tax=termite gut metagenome TaxID=433724 RepID=A0A5J4QZD6_9ZZZZ